MKTPFSSLRATLRSLVVVLAALGLLALSPAARATAFTNTATGLWSATANWSGANAPSAGGGSEVTNYFIPGATDWSTNDLAGGFWLNQVYVTNNQYVNLNSGSSGNYLLFTNSTVGNLPLLTNASSVVTSGYSNNIAIVLATNLTIGTPFAGIVINSNITENTKSQLIKAGSGTLTLNGSNVYSGGTVINGGTLTVNGSIFSPNATLNVGAQLGSPGTNILNAGGAITVQTLLVTNLNIGAPTNSIFTFNGGTLTTSNFNGLAANILVASNSTLNIGGNWIMNAGTNIVMNVHTNTYNGTNYSAFTTPASSGTVNFFNGINYGQVLVNTGAVFLTMPANAIGATNTMVLNLSPAGTGNQFVVNGGQVIATNRFSSGGPQGNGIFVFGSGTSNTFIITNGGLVTTLTEAAASGLQNQNGSRNGLYVGGTNAAGNKSAWIGNGGNPSVAERFNFGNANTNWMAIDSGGVVSNVNFFGYTTTWVFVTNGGAFYHNGLIIGRTGNNSQMLVAGVDGAGNKSLVSSVGNNSQFTIGGGTGTPTSPSPGSNNWVRVDAGGVVTNLAYVCVGQDTNSWNNWLFITNGGQFYCGNGVNNISGGGIVQGAYVGYASFCFSNSISVGGGTNASLLNLGSGGTLGIGNAGGGVSNNTVTVLAGGIVTNLTYLAFGGVNATFNHQNGGTLALNGVNALVSGSGAYNLTGVAGSSSGGTLTFANGAVLTGNGTNGGNAVVMNPGSTLLPGVSGAAGTLALGNNLALNNAQMYFTVAATSNSVVNVQNTLTASGVNPVYLSLKGVLPAGNYTLLTFTNTSAVAANFALASGNANASLALNANSLVLQVTGNGLVASNDVWKGTVNGIWDTTTVNWNNGVTATNFLSGDAVVFDDTLAGNSTVTAATPGAVVTPSAVSFNNNTIPYTNNANIGGSASVVKNGTGLVVLTGTNTYSGGTQINAGVLMVTNGGAINAPNSTLVIANTGTNILGNGGSITVQSLVVASNETPVLQNQPAFIFNLGGTLTTSNGSGTGYAANILLSSNVTWNINGTWNLNAGTNLLVNANTNLVSIAGNVGTAYIGNGVSNALVTVNSNAVLWSTVPAGSQATNVTGLTVGNANAVNNQLVVNGGTVLFTNLNGQEIPIIVGAGGASISNLLTITNGGQVYTAGLRSGGPQAGVVGQAGTANGLYVAGTNGAGRQSLWNFAKDRLIIGATGASGSTNSWVRVDQGGVLTNVTLFLYCINSSLFITNGGQFYPGGGMTVGRLGSTNNLIVWGADPYGNPAYLNGGGNALSLGGGSAGNPGTNNVVLVGPGGVMTNVAAINVGGTVNTDYNNFDNGLVVNNGGQLFSTANSVIGIGTNCNNNSITVGGGLGASLWRLNNNSMTIGVSFDLIGNGSSNNYAILYTNGMVTNISSVILGGYNSALYFNGGTLAAGGSGNLIATNLATASITNAINATNFIQAGGAFISDSGFNVTNQLAMKQDPNSTGGGLTKLGSGLLALQGVSTYTGNTTNSAGTLAVNNTGAIGTGLLVLNGGGLLGSATCTVTNAVNLNSNSIVGANAGQILTLTGFITNTGSLTLTNNGGVVAISGNATNIGGNVILNSGAQLAPGGVGTVGALNLTNNLTLNGGTLLLDVATGGSDLVAVGNTLTANGVNTIYVSTLGQLASGNYTLMTFASLSGTLANFALAGGNANCSLALVGNTLVLQVAVGGITSDTWKGYQSGTWDAAALNWTNTIGGPSVAYAAGDAVLFDDTLVANSVIAGGTLSPGWVTFNNSLTNYLINAAISGTGSLVKNGTASVTLAGANTYGSNTMINAGTLVVTNGGSITSPAGNLVVGTAPGVAGTLTLTNSGAIAVQSLLLTNTPIAGAASSIFNFSGGTLTTSNGNALAANVVLASNTAWNVSGNLKLLGGTNYTASAQIGGGGNWNNIILGFSVTNTTVLVSNAYWSTGNPLTPAIPTNFLSVFVGYNSNGSSNVLNITNGGQVFVGNNGAGLGGSVSLTIGGNGALNNGLIVAGTNGAGQKSWLDAGNARLYIGQGGTTNNWCVVNGGVITNVGNSGFYSYGANSSSVIITNGGQIYINPGQNFSVGRCGNTNDYTLLGGFDASGNPSALRFMSSFGNAGGSVLIGGQGALGDSGISGTNDYMIVGQGGLVANASQIIVGDDTNAMGNYLIITNGGQVFSTAASLVGAANNYSNCVNNYILLGGNFGTTNSLWNLGGSTLTLGGSAWDTNNYVTLLSGGLMTNVSAVILQGYNSHLNFNGGTLAAAGNGSLLQTNSSTLAGATNWVQAGGATINDNGYNVTITLPLTGDPNSTGGGLTKLGGGTLTLTATNTYTGLTTINAGTLLVTNNVALNTGQVVLNGGALFAGGTCTLTNAINLSAASAVGAGSGILTLTGFITNTASLTVGGLGVTVFSGNAATISGSVTLSAGAQLAPGGLGTVGTLNLTNNLTLNGGGTLLFDVTGSGNDLVAVGNTLAASGVTTVFVSVPGPLAQGTSYTLMTFTNNTATLANFVLAGLNTNNITLALTANTLVLQVAAGSGNIGLAGDTWKGYLSGTWDTLVLNWTNANPIVAYTDNNESVLFDDSLVANSIITNAVPAGVVSPAAVTFNNNLTSYVINANIGGTNTLNKYGLGMVTLGGTNNFTGGINLYAGTLVVTNDRSLGASNVAETITLNGSGTLQVNANFPLNTNRILNLTGAGGTLYGNGAALILTNNILQGSGPLFMTGNAFSTTTPLSFGNQSNYSGTIIVLSGRPGLGANNITNPYGTGTIIITNGNGGNVGSEMFLQAGTNCVFGNTFILSGVGSEAFGAIRTPAPQIFTGTIILTNYPYGSAQIGSSETANTTNYFYGPVTGPANLVVAKSSGVNTYSVFSGTNTYTGNTTIGASGSTPAQFMIGGAGSLGSGGNYAGYITNFGGFVYGAAGSQTLSGTMSGYGSNTITAGILTLTGINYYTGSTFVNGGELLVNGNNAAATGTVQVNMGILGGTGTIGGIVNVAGILAAGGTNSIGTLTLTNNLTLNGGVLLADLPTSGTVCDLVAVGGTLTLNSSNLVTLAFPNGATPVGTYTLMTYAAKTGSGTLVLNGNYPNTILTVGPTSVTLTVSSGTISSGSIPTPFNWNGNLSGSWDINTTANWLTNGSSAVYLDGNAVTFDDTATSYTVSNAIGSTFFSPGSVSVLNIQNPYTISAVIGGAATVTKAGGNVLTLTGNNTFSGGLVLNGGTLNLNGTNAFSGGLALNSGTLNLNGTNNFSGGLALNAGTLNLNNAFGAGTGAWTINGGTVDDTFGTISNVNNNAQSWNNSFTFGGTANLNLGAGTVTLSTNVTVTGATGNTLTLGGNISLGNNYLTHAGNGGLNTMGVISGTGGVTNLAGSMYLTNIQNTYSGITYLGGGTNYFTSITPVNGGPSSLGNPSSAANGVLNLGGVANFMGTGTYTSDRVINSVGGFTMFNVNGGTLILSGGIINNGATFRGNVGNIVLTGPLILGAGGLGRTDAGMVTITNSLNSFTNNVSISVGTFVVDTLANGGLPCSLGAGVVGQGGYINLGQVNTTAQGILQFVGTNGTTCNRTIYVLNGPLPTDGGCLSNTATGNTITFSGNITVGNSGSTVTNNWTTLGLGGSGNGIISGTLGGGTAVSNRLGILKTGTGTWTLSGVNTNNGPIMVNAGALFINGNSGAVTNNPNLTNNLAGNPSFIGGTNSVTVAGGATFGGSGIIGGNVYLKSGATLVAGGGFGTNVNGSLTLMTINLTSGATYTTTNYANSTLTLNSNTLVFNLFNNGTCNQVLNGGNLTNNGVNLISLSFPSGLVPAGTYTLMTNAATIGTGSFALAGSYANVTLNVTATSVTVTVGAGGTLGGLGNNLNVWKGFVSGIWDVNNTANWLTNGLVGTYFNGNAVVFDDNLASNSVISGGTMTPGSVTFNNLNTNYTINAGIAGTGPLALLGTGAVVITNTAGYNPGSITIKGGNVTMSRLNNGSYANSISNNGTLNYVNAGVQTWSGTIAGSGRLNVGGTTLLINGNAAGATNNLTVTNGAAFGGSGTNGGNVFLNAGAQLYPGGLGAVATLTLTNNLALAGNTLFYELGNTAGLSDLVGITNTLYLTNVNTIVLNSANGIVPQGTYTLMTMTATAGPGSFALANYGGYTNITLNQSATSVTLTVGTGGTYVSSLTWKGYVNGSWNINTTANWATNGIAATYADGNAVVFDDTLTGNSVVSNTTPGAVVAPGSVTFNNSLTNYLVSANLGGSGWLNLVGTGTVTLAGTNTYTGNTTINLGTLVETNGGSIYSPNAVLNIGPVIGSGGTNTLLAGGAITVQSLLATNITFAATNSVFNFNGGTLTTSNNNGLAASILVTSNGIWSINGVWNMNGGTNTFVNLATNGNASANIYVGNLVNNAQVMVNPGAVWWSTMPAYNQYYQAGVTNVGSASNVLSMFIGNNNATNNQVVVNGGTLIATNYYGQNNVIIVGNSSGSINSQLIVTNGGQVYVAGLRSSGPTAISIGAGGTNNGIYVGGTNSAGGKSFIDTATDRLALNNFNNWVRVDKGGLITNVSLLIGGNGNNAVYITNGGVIVANWVTLGRGATNDTINIAGADSANNLATLTYVAGTPLVIGGAYPNSPVPGNPGINCAAIVGQNGQVTNWNAIYVGGGSATDSNCVNNALIITNGGQVFNAASSVANSLIGWMNGCSSNYISLGGGGGTSLWDLGSKSLTIGFNALSTNNYMALFPGGIMTNFSSIILGGNNSSFYQNGGILAGNASGTAVSGSGTLVLNGDASVSTNTLTLSSGVLLTGSGTNGGSVVLNAGASLAPAGVNSIGTLTLTNSLTLNGNNLFYDLSSAANDLVTASNLVLNGVNTVNLALTAGRLTSGTYTLMTFANGYTGAGSFALGGAFSNTPNATLVLNANSLVLSVGAGGILGDTWKGYQSGVWDTSALNWTNLIGSPSVAYADGDAVLFDDTLVKNSVISGGPLAPGSMLFNNSLTNYLINASIGGTGGLTKSGSATVALAGANTYTSNTVINAGTLVVTNSGAIFSPNATLNIGAQVGSAGTLTLTNGAITVQTLLATNVAPGGGNTGINSVFNFNGGTLTTSNLNGVAANLLIASNATWNLNGIWNANAGTNIIVGLNTNGGSGAGVFVGNGVNGAQLNVNSNAVWWHQLSGPVPQVTNEIALFVGSGNATNNQLLVNGGTVIITNGITTGANGGVISVNIGNSAGSINNQVVVTNGGRLVTRGRGDTGFNDIVVGVTGTNNSLIVGGTNAAGGKSLVDLRNDRLSIGNGLASGAYSWLQVGSGGVITNANVYIMGNYSALYVTNGGQLYVNGFAVGRNCSNSIAVVGGTDAGGNKSIVGLASYSGSTSFGLTVGGASGTGSQPEAFHTMRIDAGGMVTNAGSVGIGGSSGAFSDSNVVGNVMIITNGGQLFSVGTSWVGYQNGCASNQLSLGGGSGMSLWRMNNNSLTLGNDLYASNNVMTLFNGGVLTNVSSLIFGGSYSVLNFNGGTLAAGGNGNLIATNSGTFLNATNALYTNLCYFATNYIQTGGAVIDSVTFTVTNVVPFAEDPGSTGGGLTKLGSGSLTLLGANTYTGPTVVSAGTLALTGSASIANSSRIVLAGGTIFNVAGLSSTFALASGQVLSNSTSTATIAGGFNTASGTVALTYAAGTPSLTVTNGTLTLAAGTVFRVNSAGLLPGTYKLVSKLTGGSVSGSLPSSVTVVGGPNAGTPVLSILSGELYLTVGGYSAWTYSGTSFTYNGAAQGPSLTSYSGSTNVITTNYVGVSPTSYGPSVNAPTNAGSYYVTNKVLADVNYFGFTNSQGFTIAQTNLTVTAASNTKVYDGTTSAATLPLTGPGSIQSGDTATLTETYATPAGGTGKTLNPAVTITNAAGMNVTASYNVTLVPDTTGVITAASVTFDLFSSAQTNGYHDGVFFIATNLPVGAGSNVVFQANGLPFSTNNVANGGTTSLTITNLPRGNTNVIIATYNGDGNYAAYVTNLIQTVTNHPPVATNLVVYRNAGQTLHLFWSDVATNWSDADGDTVTNVSINLVTTNGVTLQTNSALILYTNSLNVNDQFTYTIQDSYGDTNTGVVNIIMNNSNPFVGQENTTIISTNGGLQMTFYGVLGYTYVVQRNQVDITDTNYWLDFITNSVITNQVMIITDTNNPNPPGSFYRLKWQP